MSAFYRKNSRTLDDRAKARIVPDYICSGNGSGSGSDHSAVEADDKSLSDLFYGFLVNDVVPQSSADELDSELDRSKYDLAEAMQELSKSIVQCNLDSCRNVLFAHITKALEIFSFVKSNAPLFRRNVMAYLRSLGYNAAICKTKWENSGGLTAGNYEFIDVIRCDSDNQLVRYFIDLDFAMEFEIARPTTQYEYLVQSLPKIFVGQNEELKQILKVIRSDAAKRSLKNKNLHMPPWRKHRYMQNKWFGLYKRTTNLFSISSSSVASPQPSAKQNFAVKCHLIGFDTTVVDSSMFFHPMARTR